ncbi:S8 family peptidase [Lentimicrobium sp. S6]|uniref:S8 family peptidase n=1 Tax=Lentimicrobium sp. S6 TaxID=2735872 RepID=UPI001555C463|nr:S8 family peptidase [Lentimicrobium sp. S6]NPD45382.1 S8 family peptidase [Lentimicrobium sp. S6]
MEQFPHLNFVQKLKGKPRYHGGGNENNRTRENKEDRKGHSEKLQRWTTGNKSNWEQSINLRNEENLATLNEEIIPIFIQINPEIINAEFDLESFGIEVISEEEDGYIIGASLDNFRTLENKINGFVESERGTGEIANFWEIFEGNRNDWKPKHILSEELYSKWHEIEDNKVYNVEVSIAFAKSIGKEPDPTKRGGESRLRKYREKQIELDDLLMERESHFEEFINHYGVITSSIVYLEDSFGCEVSISGTGLKDLVVNYQFVFEISEIEEITGIEGADSEVPEIEIDILPPNEGSIEVGVIDSGIMENHKYIAPAIKKENSQSYIEGDDSTVDHVLGGGHGTKVAGAILYPNGLTDLPIPYQLPCFIRNIRVLDDNNELSHNYPAELVQKIVSNNSDCKIFNLSVCAKTPHRTRHMSSWAAIIDKVIYEEDLLFLVSVGNISFQDIANYLNNGKPYPQYLEEKLCRLANPSQSSFALSVGSINYTPFEDEYWTSIGGADEVSPFSRIGTGIWGKIKPDVVEYGGGLVSSRNGFNQIREHEVTSPELIRSTLHGGGAMSKDCVGTSFSTPKVAHIAAILKQLYPEEQSNLIRAFIAQGARLPNNHFRTPSKTSIQHFGYGLPSLERVTKNSEHRITFYNTGNIKAEEAHLYSLKIPEELRGQGEEYDILIEITLAFSAQVRRTRQKTKSYLSTWLDWSTAKIGERFEDFKDYALKETGETELAYDRGARNELHNFDWKIKNRTDQGTVADINRTNSSLQKDWTIVRSYELPEDISIAVRGHKGWDKNMNEVPYALTVSIEILGSDIPIYELIRLENEIEIEV